LNDTAEAIILAAVVIVVMTTGMRMIYGYWPWRRQPRVPELSDTEIADLKREWEMAAVFRAQPPPFQPFSEKDKGEPPAQSDTDGKPSA